MRCPVLVGREGELAALGGLLARAASGCGGSGFVVGEAGIGKSRLLAATGDIARSRDMAVLRGRAAPSVAPAPYRPVAEALLSALRGRDLKDASTLRRFRSALAVLAPGVLDVEIDVKPSVVLLGEATLALLERVAGPRGVLLLLEDLHWAGSETCELVDYLTDKLEGTSIALVASVRTGSASDADHLARAAEARGDATLIPLRRLDGAAIDALVAASLGTATAPSEVRLAVAAASGGVPLLAEDVLATLVDAGALRPDDSGWWATPALPTVVPTSFAALVGDRLRPLDDTTRRVLAAAAVLGERFDWELLAPVTGLDRDAVVAALRRGVTDQLVDESPGAGAARFRFRHGLSRAAVLDAMAERDRGEIAARALAVLDDISADADHPTRLELVADLAVLAGEAARASRTLVAASRAAAQRGACASAQRFAEQAVELAARAEEEREARLALLDACTAAGDAQRAAAVGAQLLADFERAGFGGARVAEVHERLAAAAVEATDWARAEAHLDAAAEAAPASTPPAYARAELLRTEIALGRHDPSLAMLHADRARAAAEGDSAIVAHAWRLLGRAHRVTDVDAARRAFVEAVADSERAGSELLIARAEHELATLDVLLAGPPDRLERARRLAVEVGAVGLAAGADLQLSILHWLRFDLDAARAASARAADIATRHHLGLLAPLAAAISASVDAVLGRRDAAMALFERALPVMDGELEATGRGHVLAVAAIAVEDRPTALAELARAAELVPPYSDVARATHAGLRALLLAVDDGPMAVHVCGALDDDPAIVGPARHLCDVALAVLRGRSGEHDEAVVRAHRAFGALVPTPWFLAVAQRLAAEAAVTDGWGTPVSWLRAALAFFDAHGIDEPAAACRAWLKRAGAAAPLRTADGQHPELAALGITRREADVLALLADGLSNREVAEKLFLSVRTVEKHVERLMTKTATSNRTQLAALANRLAPAT